MFIAHHVDYDDHHYHLDSPTCKVYYYRYYYYLLLPILLFIIIISTLQLAKCKNILPLPTARSGHGPRLPPDRFCLTATNFRLKPRKKKMRLSHSTKHPGAAGASEDPPGSDNLMEDGAWESPLFTLHFDANMEGQPFSLEQATENI